MNLCPVQKVAKYTLLEHLQKKVWTISYIIVTQMSVKDKKTAVPETT